jgi:ubiquinone/menaquinone biosynthesis C-methylase UbiE
MPTIEDNYLCWGKTYHWKDSGDEWSQAWGGTAYLWYGTILPRILSFVPTGTILEIAPGYGRCTQFLINLCTHLDIVDLNTNCIESCKKRFSKNSNVSYHTTDGKSLDMIAKDSIDFIFSWDSLVHCEADVLNSYLSESSRILKPGGCGFLHHSNIGQYFDVSTGKISCKNLHARGETMTAQLFREFCERHDLFCVRQETVNWGGDIQNDCFSVFIKNPVNSHLTAEYFENSRFHIECSQIKNTAEFYKDVKER